MARRLKTTPFARFLIAMLFIVPAAYIGASYYNGQDPIQQIKDLFNRQGSTTAAGQQAEGVASGDTYDLRSEVEQLKARIVELELENAELKEKVRRLEMQQ